jgi:DNA-binding response OmpR family regulator
MAKRSPPTVLWVGDDPTTRGVMTLVLSQQGYTVLAAGDSREALGLLGKAPAPVDVAVLDLAAPDAASVALCSWLRERSPRLPVIVCSSKIPPPGLARLLETGACRYFRRPVTVDELLASVKAVIPLAALIRL